MLRRVKCALNSSQKIARRRASRNRQPPSRFQNYLRSVRSNGQQCQSRQTRIIPVPAQSSDQRNQGGCQKRARYGPMPCGLALQCLHGPPEQKSAEERCRCPQDKTVETKKEQSEHGTNPEKVFCRAAHVFSPDERAHKEAAKNPCSEVINQASAARHMRR